MCRWGFLKAKKDIDKLTHCIAKSNWFRPFFSLVHAKADTGPVPPFEFLFGGCFYKFWQLTRILFKYIHIQYIHVFIFYISFSIYRLIDCIFIIVQFENISPIKGRHQCRWRAENSALTARLYRDIPAMTQTSVNMVLSEEPPGLIDEKSGGSKADLTHIPMEWTFCNIVKLHVRLLHSPIINGCIFFLQLQKLSSQVATVSGSGTRL